MLNLPVSLVDSPSIFSPLFTDHNDHTAAWLTLSKQRVSLNKSMNTDISVDKSIKSTSWWFIFLVMMILKGSSKLDRYGVMNSSQNIFNAKNFNPHKSQYNPFVKYSHLHTEYAANLVASSKYYHCHWIMLPESMMTYFHLEPKHHTSMKFEIKNFSIRKMHMEILSLKHFPLC